MTDFAESQLTVPAEGFNPSDPSLYLDGAICGKEKFPCLKSHVNFYGIAGTNITDRITGRVFDASAAGMTTFPGTKEFELLLVNFVASGPVLNIAAPPAGVQKHIYAVVVGQTQNNGTNDGLNITYINAALTCRLECLNTSAGAVSTLRPDNGTAVATPAPAASVAARPYVSHVRGRILSTGATGGHITLTRKVLSSGATETSVTDSVSTSISGPITLADRITLRGRLFGAAVFAFEAAGVGVPNNTDFIELNLFIMAKQWQAGNINFIPPEFRGMVG